MGSVSSSSNILIQHLFENIPGMETNFWSSFLSLVISLHNWMSSILRNEEQNEEKLLRFYFKPPVKMSFCRKQALKTSTACPSCSYIHSIACRKTFPVKSEVKVSVNTIFYQNKFHWLKLKQSLFSNEITDNMFCYSHCNHTYAHKLTNSSRHILLP